MRLHSWIPIARALSRWRRSHSSIVPCRSPNAPPDSRVLLLAMLVRTCVKSRRSVQPLRPASNFRSLCVLGFLIRPAPTVNLRLLSYAVAASRFRRVLQQMAISVHCASSPIGVGLPVEPWCRARVLGVHQVRGGKTNAPSDQPTGRASIVVNGQRIMVRELIVKGKPT